MPSRELHRENEMAARKKKASNKIVDTVANAVVGAEIAVVRAGRSAVKAMQRGVEAGARSVGITAKKKAAKKKSVKKAATRRKRR